MEIINKLKELNNIIKIKRTPILFSKGLNDDIDNNYCYEMQVVENADILFIEKSVDLLESKIKEFNKVFQIIIRFYIFIT